MNLLKTLFVLIPALAGLLAGCGSEEPEKPRVARQYGYRVVNQYPHDTAAFTQGLIYYNDFLYEGTGNRGRSDLRKVDLRSGEVLQRQAIPDSLFGEGITIFDSKIYQLTWLDGIAFVWDLETFDSLGSFPLDAQGWGLTHNGSSLIASDGTPTIYFRDPQTFAIRRTIQVHDHLGPIVGLNELEYVKGEIWANIWQFNFLARISPDDGQVLGWIRLAGLEQPVDSLTGSGVLNGIAYDADHERIYVTGKNWPVLYEIEVVPLDLPAD
ncbi:MAG: glutaminyl-peptide cyclotransferase [bacterium]